MHNWIVVCIALQLLSHQASAQVPQAPGDESSSCGLQDLGENKKVLLDSRHYENLLQSGAWDTNNGVWAYRLGGACSRQVRSCSESSEAQDNWMFTQHISKDVPSKLDVFPLNIFVEVQYRFSCTVSTVCALGSGTGQMLGVYRYTVDTPVPQNQKNTGLYTLIDTIKDSSILAGRVKTIMFTLNTNEDGFYLGFRDEGTCFQLERLTVYRYTGEPQTIGLLMYPSDAPAPVSGTDFIPGTCADNAASFDFMDPLIQISSTGEWGMNPDMCFCTPGFEYVADPQCIACSEGEFKAELSNNDLCIPCPENSMSGGVAAAVCPCKEGFIRSPDRPGDACSRSPSAPNVAFNTGPVVTDNLEVTLCWLPPMEKGGGDSFFYNIYVHEVDNEQLLLTIVNEAPIEPEDTGNMICYKTDLMRNGEYLFLVTSENSATSTPDDVTDLSKVDGRYLPFFVTAGAVEMAGAAEMAAAMVITIFGVLMAAVLGM